MNALEIKLCNSVEEAPIYQKEDFTALVLKQAVVVKNGTVEGNPTVDLVLTDADGKSYIAMVTGRILKTLSSVIGNTNNEMN